MPSSQKRWLSIVGIGEDGVDGLSAGALELIETAEHVFGGRRHLMLAADRIRGVAHPWPSPFDLAMREVVALRGHSVCVLASGDPFCHGVGATLARHVPAEETLAVPAPSAFSLAASRLGWPLQEVETVSLHGRPPELIRPLLSPGRKILALTSDADGPAMVAEILLADGFSGSRLTILEALGGPDEKVTATTVGESLPATVNPLNLAAIEVAAWPNARILARAPGLADGMFVHDGQITKREIRAITLSALRPLRGQLLWDIGAGCGSVAIEWMLADPSMQAIAVERDVNRCANIRQNALRCGVPAVEIVEGEAPDALAGLPPPDAIFVGGGGSRDGLLDVAIAALRPEGRLVANAVTLEMEAALLASHANHGGELTRISIERAAPVGSMSGWRPAMPVLQWSWTKP